MIPPSFSAGDVVKAPFWNFWEVSGATGPPEVPFLCLCHASLQLSLQCMKVIPSPPPVPH